MKQCEKAAKPAMANNLLYPSIDTDAHNQGSYYSTKSPGIEAQFGTQGEKARLNPSKSHDHRVKITSTGNRIPGGQRDAENSSRQCLSSGEAEAKPTSQSERNSVAARPSI
jgi:hypothetical protein